MGNSRYVDEMCNMDKIMCPLCDQHCNYWHFGPSACRHIKWVYFFENYATLAYGSIIALWAILFLEFWKREKAVLDYNWDLTRHTKDRKPIRPEYSHHPSRTTKLNPTTNQPEPYVPFSIRLPRRFLSFTFVIFGLLIIAGAFIAIIIYRLAAEIMLANAYANDDEISEVNKKLTASIISLCTFLPLNALFTI